MSASSMQEHPAQRSPAETDGAQRKAVFRLEGVGRRWGSREALRDVSLEIRAGERILLAGPSGSGKSTLLRILNGSLRPTAGRVVVGGVDLAAMSPRELRRHRRACGIVEQGNLLVPQLDVHRNVLAGRLAHWPWHRVLLSAVWPIERERVSALLDEVGLADRQWDVTANLSGGQQQRVAVARALVSSPSIVIAHLRSVEVSIARPIQPAASSSVNESRLPTRSAVTRSSLNHIWTAAASPGRKSRRVTSARGMAVDVIRRGRGR